MIKLFCTEIPEALTSIDIAMTAGDIAEIKRTAHRIKPTFDTMGIVSLITPVRDLEQIRVIDNDARGMLERMKQVCEKVIEAFMKIV
jgi:HPt (histidine-containing phosphotransfer) domain-containing protein